MGSGGGTACPAWGWEGDCGDVGEEPGDDEVRSTGSGGTVRIRKGEADVDLQRGALAQ